MVASLLGARTLLVSPGITTRNLRLYIYSLAFSLQQVSLGEQSGGASESGGASSDLLDEAFRCEGAGPTLED